MAIKGIIFDLDDTLYDCTGTVFARTCRQALKEMAKIVHVPFSRLNKKYAALLKKEPNFITLSHQLCHEFNIPAAHAARACAKAREVYYGAAADMRGVRLFPGAAAMLLRLRKKYKLGLVTFGGFERQNRKIDALRLRKRFDFIGVDQYGKLQLTKKECFEDFLRKMKLTPEEAICVGDKVMDEIKNANRLGIATVRILCGRYAKIAPADDYEIPDYTFKKVTDVEKLVKKLSS